MSGLTPISQADYAADDAAAAARTPEESARIRALGSFTAVPPGASSAGGDDVPEGITLNPKAAPAEPLPDGITLDAKPGRAAGHDPNAFVGSTMERFIDGSPIGRILDAFGQGAKDGWGASSLGISPEGHQELAKLGLFNDLNDRHTTLLKTFNEAIIRPSAAALEAMTRGFGAATTSLAEGVGQTAQELGMEPGTANRGVRDVRMLAETALTLMGAVAPRLSPPRSAPLRIGEPAPAPTTGSLVVARQMPDGTVRYGEPGRLHASLFDESEPWNNEVQQAMGWAVPGGKFMTRHEALAYLQENAPKKSDPGYGLEGSDLEGHPAPGSDYAGSPPTGEPRPRSQAADIPQDRISHTPFPPDETYVDKAGNIRLDNLNKPDDVKQVFRDTAAQMNDHMDARGGKISDVQRAVAAEALGLDAKFEPKVPDGVSWSTWTEAVKRLAIQSAESVRDAMLKARASGDEADLLKYAEARARHMMIQEEYAKVTAEGGRTLNALKKDRATAKADQSLNDFLKETTGNSLDDLKTEIENGTKLNSPEQLSRFIGDARKPTFKDMFLEYWVNAMVSGPKTHVANIIGNTITALTAVPETFVAGVVGQVRRAAGNTGERVLIGETGAHIFGIVQGAREGIVAAGETLISGKSISGSTQMPVREAIPGKLGGVIRGPNRLLSAEDEFFKGIAYRTEINRLAYREGKGDPMRVAELSQNPTPEMMAAATENAKYQTFQNDLTGYMKAVQDFSNQGVIGKAVFMFVRTPTNILKYSFERTPVLNATMKDVRENLTGANGKVAQDTAIARLAIGSAAMVTSYMLAQDGTVTGVGPTDPGRRALNLLNGIPPDSIRVGDMYYAYNRLQPWATNIAIAADLYAIRHAFESDDPAVADHIGKLAGAAVVNNVMNVSALRGVSDLIKATSDWERNGEKYVQNLVGSLVPGAVAQVTQSQDPYMREVHSMADALRNRVGLSQDLPPVVDVWGQPTERPGALGPDFASPISMRKISDDPVNKELLRLRTWPGMPRKDMNVAAVKSTVDLKDRQELYNEYATIAGRMAKQMLDGTVAAPGWERVPDWAKREVIAKQVQASRKIAAATMSVRHPELVQEAAENRLGRYTDD